MKKVVLFALAALSLAACGSLRTADNGKTYYATLFGISIESLVYGNGIIVDKVGQYK